MQTTTPLINQPLTDDKKYAVADAIVANCNHLSPDVVKANTKFYFREIINSRIVVNKTNTTVALAFIEDDASHITNLVLNRLQAPQLVKTIANVTVEAQ